MVSGWLVLAKKLSDKEREILEIQPNVNLIAGQMHTELLELCHWNKGVLYPQTQFNSQFAYCRVMGVYQTD